MHTSEVFAYSFEYCTVNSDIQYFVLSHTFYFFNNSTSLCKTWWRFIQHNFRMFHI